MLGNLQVVLVAFAAWAVLGERPERRIVVAVPVVFTGAVMISGVLESGGYGRDPVLGTVFGLLTTLAYSAFILVLRQVNRDVRRPAGPLLDATAAAAVVSARGGRAHRRRRPRAELAVARMAGAARADLAGARVAADLGLAAAAPGRVTSVLLLVQPVGSIVLAVIILGEDPSALQLAGTGVILAGICLATVTLPAGSRRLTLK